MKRIIHKQTLKLQYREGFGAWTYHLVIPGTSSIKGTWGRMKVIGKIDDVLIKGIHLAPRKNKDKIISINQHIRNALKKTSGDEVVVTLFLLDWLDGIKEIEELLSSL